MVRVGCLHGMANSLLAVSPLPILPSIIVMILDRVKFGLIFLHLVSEQIEGD